MITRTAMLLAAAVFALPLGSCARSPQSSGLVEADTAEVDVVEAIRERPQFSTLARAVTETGLAEDLADDGPFTVFAPTDDAFNALPQSARDKLFQEGNRAQLETLLKHHIVLGEVYPATGIPKRLTPMEGEPIDVGMVEGRPVLSPGSGRQAMIEGDIEADNGIIHAVDAVLVPQQVAQALQIGPQQPGQGGMQQQVQQMQQSLQQAEQALQQNNAQQARQALDEVRQTLDQAEGQAQGQQRQTLGQVDQQLQQAEDALQRNDTQQAQQALAQAQQPLRQMPSQ